MATKDILTKGSHKTAISRTKPSAPMKYLFKQNLLKGRKLDYGCGRGFDADYFKMSKFDPHYFPDKPEGKYDTITCNYVLNVIGREEGIEVLKTIRSKLRPNGIAYITVRRDIEKSVLTSKGTFQRNVILNLSVIRETKAFCIYELKRENKRR